MVTWAVEFVELFAPGNPPPKKDLGKEDGSVPVAGESNEVRGDGNDAGIVRLWIR